MDNYKTYRIAQDVASFFAITVFMFICLALTGCDPDYRGRIETAIRNHDFSKANELLKEMENPNVAPWYHHQVVSEYPICLNEVIQAEISYLVNEKDQQASDRLIALINEYPIKSNPAIGTTHDSDIIEANDNYNAEVGKFNDYCNQILSRAISTKNQYLAEAIVNNIKPTLNRTKVDTHLFGSDEYDYQYVDFDKDKAKQILMDAIKDGKFKDLD